MKLLLGFTFPQALEFAEKQKWYIGPAKNIKTSDGGEPVAHHRGYGDISRLAGEQFSQVILGPITINPDILEWAKARVR